MFLASKNIPMRFATEKTWEIESMATGIIASSKETQKKLEN